MMRHHIPSTRSLAWRTGVFLVLGGAALVTTRAAGGRAMTIDDLLAAVRVSDPQLSPDGRTVLFTRTSTNLGDGKRNADIWRVATDGTSDARGVLGGDTSESSPRFLPDGRIAFIATRDGAPQVYVGDADGHIVRQLTSLATGVQAPLVVSPDGSKIAVVSDVYGGCLTAVDTTCNQRRQQEVDKNPVKARRLTRLLFRHWDEWREDLRHHIFVVDVATGRAADVTPGDFDSPPTQQEDGALAFSPDGREVAFVSNREGADREAWTTNNDVWLVGISGGTPRKLTPNPAADAQPVFAPDGRTVFVRSQRRAGFESDRWYLDAYDRTSGGKRTLFESPDLSVDEFVLSNDGRTIWFTAQQGGRSQLFRIPSTGGSPTMTQQGGAIGSIRVAANVVVYVKSTMTAPAEIFGASIEGGSDRALTRENAPWLREVALAAPESRTVTGAAGAKIQYWLIRPPDFDPSKKYPVVFLIHGGPQGAWEDAWSSRWNPSLWAAQGWVVAAPNPRGSTGFGQQFVDDVSGDWGGKAIADIEAVIDQVTKLPFVDAQRAGIAGASYGGYAVNWMLGHTTRFKAAVTHDGVFNLESMSLATEELWFPEWEFGGVPWDPKAREQLAKWSPHLFAHHIRTPTLIITNELDYRVPVDQGLQMFTVLRRNGVPAEALVFPDEGHWVLKALNSKAWHEAVFGWMKKYL